MNTFRINTIIIFVILILNYFNYSHIQNEEYIPLCLGNLDLINIGIVATFMILGTVFSLFKYTTEDITKIKITILRFTLLATLLATLHIYSLMFINYLYC